MAFEAPEKVSSPSDYLFPLDATATDTNKVKLDLKTSLVDTWKEMIKLKETGKVKGTFKFVDELV